MRVRMQAQALELSWIGDTNESCHDDNSDPSTLIVPSSIEGHGRRTLRIPYAPISNQRRREIILPLNAKGYIKPIRDGDRQNLVTAIAQGRAWLQAITSGRETIAIIAARARRSERAPWQVLSLALLNPALVRAALQGLLLRGVSARRLYDAPLSWHAQWQSLGLRRPALIRAIQEEIELPRPREHGRSVYCSAQAIFLSKPLPELSCTKPSCDDNKLLNFDARHDGFTVPRSTNRRA